MPRIPNKKFDYTNKDYEAFRQMMLDDLKIKMPEYTDLRQSDAGVVIIELLAQGLDIISLYQDIIANECFLVTAEQKDSILKWCKMLSYYPKFSKPSRFKQVFVLSEVQTEDFLIPKGTIVKTVGSEIENEIEFEVEKDFIIPRGKLGNEKTLEKYDYLADVVQGVTVSDEYVGSSNETANQRFILNYSPVIVDSIELFVNEGDGFEQWERVDNFIDSNSDSKHFTVSLNDNDEAIIEFGNNVFGKIPKEFANGIIANYRVGGGVEGNVGANKITALDDSELGLIYSTFNPETAYELGVDKESIEEIKYNLPLSFKNKWGALTENDFADIIKVNFREVKYAVGKKHPTNIDDVQIFLILKSLQNVDAELKKEINNFFDANKGGRKIIGANNIEIKDAIKVPQTITSTLIVEERYKREEVKKNVEDLIRDFFEYGNYQFDTPLSFSKLCSEVLTQIEGVKVFKITSPTNDVLTPSIGEVYTLNDLTINASGGV